MREDPVYLYNIYIFLIRDSSQELNAIGKLTMISKGLSGVKNADILKKRRRWAYPSEAFAADRSAN
ncbi:hypothetical protein SAMN03159358_1266 [Paenibacillus sp. NFR01]|nr:hypothetical protein SAMN03159358_1266 [Paenibacillus sp. NFR01]